MNPFKKLKAAHTREKAEDYVEMIETLVEEQGEARLTELAKRFGVSIVTVHKIIARLQKEKFKKRFWIISVAVVMTFSTPSFAEEEEPLGTDRPDAAESSKVVCQYRLQLETSF